METRKEGRPERGAGVSSPPFARKALLVVMAAWGAGCTEVPSKELPATLSLRLPAFTRAHSLLHPWLLF